MWISRVKRDDTLITEIEKEVTEFLAEVDAKIAALNTDYGIAA